MPEKILTEKEIDEAVAQIEKDTGITLNSEGIILLAKGMVFGIPADGYHRKLWDYAIRIIFTLRQSQKELGEAKESLEAEKKLREGAHSASRIFEASNVDLNRQLSDAKKEIEGLKSDKGILIAQTDRERGEFSKLIDELRKDWESAEANVKSLHTQLSEARKAIEAHWQYGNDGFIRCHFCHTFVARKVDGEVLVKHPSTCIVLSCQKGE